MLLFGIVIHWYTRWSDPFATPMQTSLTERSVLLLVVALAHGALLALLLSSTFELESNSAPGVLQMSWLAAQQPDSPAERSPSEEAKPLPMKLKPVAVVPPTTQPIAARDADTSTSSSAETVPPLRSSEVLRPEDVALSRGPQATVGREPADVAQPDTPEFDPDYLTNPAPDYPARSRQLHEQGLTILRVHVTSKGSADEVQLYQSSGFDRLDKAAVDVVWRWRFVPARQGHEPAASWVIVPIHFMLRH